MSLFHRSTVTHKVYTDASLAQTLANRQSSIADATNVAEHTGGHYRMEANATDMPIALGPLTTALGLYVETTRKCTLKLNGSHVIPLGTTEQQTATLCLTATEITSLSVTNTSGQEGTIYVSMPGK